MIGAIALFLLLISGPAWAQMISGPGVNSTVAYNIVTEGGADKTGVADATSAMNAALASGRPVYFPAGSYKFPLATAIKFSLSDKYIFGDGQGNTVLNLSTSDTSSHQVFATAGDVTFRDLSINLTSAQTASIISIFEAAGSNLVLDRVTMDCGVVVSGGALNWTAYPLQFNATVNSVNVDVQDSEASNCSYFGLKNNADTSTQDRFRFVNSRLRNTFGGLLLNSPVAASFRDFYVAGSTFDNNTFGSIGNANVYFVGAAGGEEMQIVNNRFFGQCGEIIHIEETATRTVIAGNVAYVDCSVSPGQTAGIRLLVNNVGGGGYVSPSNFIIANNVIVQSGTQNAGICLDLGSSVNGPGLVKGKVHDNICVNWAYGINDGANQEQYTEVINNTVRDCTYGLNSVYAQPWQRDNQFINCTNGVVISNGGTLGRQLYHEVPAPMTATNMAFSFGDWTISHNGFAHSCGGATVAKALLNYTKLTWYGAISASATLSVGATNTSAQEYTTKYLAAAMTLASNFVSSPGNVGAAIVDNAGASTLDISVVCAGGSTGTIRDAAVFRGTGVMVP